ncbi:MAG: hypothetical protein U1E52_09320 [Geminicoccaceae bacterium]
MYWRYGDYVGIGPGAHGRLTLGGTGGHPDRKRIPERWLAAIESCRTGEVERERLEPREQIVEMLMMGLRLAEGVAERSLAQLAGCPLEQAIDREGLRRALEADEAERANGRLVATPGGRQRLDHVLRLLI